MALTPYVFWGYDFERLAGRIQFRGARYQSDIFCGYQSKFFGWPNMYTPEDFFDTDGIESLHTALVILNLLLTLSWPVTPGSSRGYQ